MTREEIYRLVWTGPLHRVAPQIGMSNVGLKKLCQRHTIPLPPPGYWHHRRARASPAKPTWASRSRFHNEIIAAFNEGLTAGRIRARVARLGYAGSVTSIRRYIANGPAAVPKPPVVRERPPLPPGPEIAAKKVRSFQERLKEIGRLNAAIDSTAAQVGPA